jgi:serine/threonine protein kinase
VVKVFEDNMQNGPSLSKAILLTALGNSPLAVNDIAKRLFPAIPDGWLDEFRDEGGSSMLDRIRNHLAQLAQEGEIVCNSADTYSLAKASCSGRRTNPNTRKGVEEARPQLAEYELTKVLGRGGMGTVYSGQHKTSGRVVAVKIQTAGRRDANTRGG